MKLAKSIHLKVLPGLYSISRLDSNDAIPVWADGDGFVNITRSADELSIVSHQSRVPNGVKTDRDWRCMQFVGPFAFDELGIVLSVVRPLTEAGFGVFVVSTFDGDFLLLKEDQFDEALAVLEKAGHQFVP
jgi:hypothetical protein